MATILLIALAAIVIRVMWAWHRGSQELSQLSPQGRANLQASTERRKAYIIEQGRLEFEAYKQQHPVLGSLRRYNGSSYYSKHLMNKERFPFGVVYPQV